MLHPAQSPPAPPAWPPTAQSQGTRACSVASPAHGCWVPPGRKQPGSCWGTAPLAEAEGFVPAPFFLSGQRPAFGARPSSARDFPALCRSRRGGASTRCHGFCPWGGESCSVRKAAPARGGDVGHGAGLRLRRVHPRALRFCPQARVGDPCRHRRICAGCSSGPAAPGALQHQTDLPRSPRSLSLLIRSSSCGMEQEQELSVRWEGGAERSPDGSTSWARGRCVLLSRASKPARSPRSWAPGWLELLAGRSPAASALGWRTPPLSPCF